MDAILLGWPLVGLGLAAALLLWLFLKPYPQYAARFRDPAWLLWLVTPIYMIHQFEEHGYDLFGNRFGFLASLCATLGHPSLSTCPADAWFIFAVNIPVIWVSGPICGLLGTRFPMAGATLYGVPAVNALAHIGPFLRTGRYNPGVLTSFLLFIPVCAWVLHQLYRQGILNARRLLFVLLCGVVLHALLMGSLQLRERGIIGVTVLLLIQVVNGLLPVFAGLLWPRRQPAPAA